jgi:hypothetical protein
MHEEIPFTKARNVEVERYTRTHASVTLILRLGGWLLAGLLAGWPAGWLASWLAGLAG